MANESAKIGKMASPASNSEGASASASAGNSASAGIAADASASASNSTTVHLETGGSAGRVAAKTATVADGTTSVKAAEMSQSQFDLSDPEWFLNRELTWLAFCRRVLHEAQDERTPLLERIKFFSIVSSNLDEFFMKRIGGLKQQVGAGVTDLTVDGRTPQQQIDECYEVVRDIEAEQDRLLPDLFELLAENGILVLSYADLEKDEKSYLRDHYLENIYPLVTPLAVDPAHPFPFISNLSINLLVTLRYPEDDERLLSRVKVPVNPTIPRFLRLPDSNRFVTLEEVMAENLELLFPKMIIESCEVFYVTRNANTERDETSADDLLEMIESELRDRKFAPIVRLVVDEKMDPSHKGILAAELGLDAEVDVFETNNLLGKRDLFDLSTLEFNELHDAPHHPTEHAKLQGAANIFHAIREHGSILLHHPYESFSSSVERFLREASRDPKVLAIKITLYRTSSDTKVVEYLIDAARNDKQVAVVVELKARFDEAANIRWANRMEEAGIHVTYGVVGLKTHCKLTLVIRQDFDGLRRYAHVGTGNYHAGTARIYTDLGMLTSDATIGKDLTELFNYLTTGYTPKRDYRKMLPAPKSLKKALLAKIEREMENHADDTPGLIQFKMNALEDTEIAQALYRASQVGVQIDLIIRDSCRLRPGIPGLSETIRVISIVGRFLEHGRIYYFRNCGDEEYFIGSADLMKRNLEHRVEAVAPIEDPAMRAELRLLLDTYLDDRRSAWEMNPDGSYVQLQPANEDEPSSQNRLISHADIRVKEATRLKKRKPKVMKRRNLGRL
ncbi:MAG: polyphosphate kinase 1 [Pseudomonadales bacterium]|jgi:polyphosphate kinase|nr:polyphosphate kinase 1 [Pseudomonadales bacterium]MDP7595768.1 polyphosphate kinase 1 [Pseudomonadales bacterium]HJN50625.1 polyphosphate kinase 1 [Pseudomonadales bacterium]|tara:strand:- start:3205 stop:5574 length:2370 start_codon:yes stop_codon:yes gene_type:complete